MMKFEVGCWYRNSKTLIARCDSIKVQNTSFNIKEIIENNVYKLNSNWWSYHGDMKKVDIDEIQQYLPPGHPDLIVKPKNYDFIISILDKLDIR